MPTYDYECKRCENVIEIFHSIHDTPKLRCEQCGKRSMQRLISGGVGIVFKSSGFYATDSKVSRASTDTSSGDNVSTNISNGNTNTDIAETKGKSGQETVKKDASSSNAGAAHRDSKQSVENKKTESAQQ